MSALSPITEWVSQQKARVFWPLASMLLLADCATKRLAERELGPQDVPHEVIGNWLQLTLAYNKSAAMGIDLGEWSRPVLAVLTFAALAILATIYRRAAIHDRWLAVALALIIGGATGNLVDRLASSRGVVDFVDIGIGDHRFWIFNVADMGVTTGAALLGWLLWKRDSLSSGEAEPTHSG